MIDTEISGYAKQTKLACIASLFFMSGCINVTVDERVAFQPQKIPFAPANNSAQLNANMAATFKSAVEEGSVRLEAAPNDGIAVAYREEFMAKYPRFRNVPPIIVNVGFIGEGTSRVAWTFYKLGSVNGSELASTRPLVVHCAGNAGDRYNSGLDYASHALEWADVFVFDYPGYGDTPGPANSENFEAASTSIIDHVTTLSQNRKLVFWGHSLGGFVCSRLAAAIPSTNGLILETTAPNATAVARAWTPTYARPLVRAKVSPSLASYDVVVSAAQIKGPILVLGATRDEVLPVNLARQVADGLKSSKANVTYVEFPRARHTSVPYQGNFKTVISDYFKTIESQP